MKLTLRIFRRFSAVIVALGLGLAAGSALAQTQYVCFETSRGEFCMQMLSDDAPNTVANFLKYVNDGDFDNTFIHRAEFSFVIQGGGYKLDPLGEPVPEDAMVANEFKVSNTRGTVAMAKFPDQPDSATSQWFVNLRDENAGTLDVTNGGYTVFARVVKGMAIVDAIDNSDRVDLSSQLGSAFTTVPVLSKDADGVGVEDLIQVTRAYVTTNVVPDEDAGNQAEAERQRLFQCTTDWVAELAPTQACMDTNLGSFCIDLMPWAAPLSVANFLHYVADGDYDGTFMHRSVENYIVQGGAIQTDPLFFPVPADPAVKLEYSEPNAKYTVALARTSDIDSATSSWFINTVDNSTNNGSANGGGYAVFGRVSDPAGQAVIDSIAALEQYNLGEMNSSFAEAPLLRTGGLTLSDFVTVSRAYIPDAPPNPCFATLPEALTVYANRSFTLPVRIDGNLFQMEFRQEFVTGYVFNANLNNVLALGDTGQEAASFSFDTGIMTIPSVRVDQTVLRNVRLRLTNRTRMQFTFDGFGQ